MIKKIITKLRGIKEKEIDLDSITLSFLNMLPLMNDNELISYIEMNSIPDTVLFHMIKNYILYRRYDLLIYIIKNRDINNIPDLDSLFHDSCYYGAYDVVEHLLTYERILSLDSLMQSARMADFCHYGEIIELIARKHNNYMRKLKINKLLHENSFVY